MTVPVYKDRVGETTTTTGTGTITTTGTAPVQYQTFVNSGIPSGSTIDYVLLSGNGTDWEVGRFAVATTVGATVTITRTPTESSNGNAAITLSGTSTVFLTLSAEQLNAMLTGSYLGRRTISTGTTDTIGATDVAVFWNSTVTAGKTETLPAANIAANDGRQLIIADEAGTAALYPITLSAAAGTVGGSANFVISQDSWSVTLVCDYSTTNWVIL